MKVADIIRRLQELQIEESNLLSELAQHESGNGASEPQPSRNNQRKNKTRSREQVKVGDEVLLLTKGAKCRKGDTATITKVGPKTVHFTVHRNGHSTYKLIENVQLIATPDP